jgi:hypothetical protein
MQTTNVNSGHPPQVRPPYSHLSCLTCYLLPVTMILVIDNEGA